MSKHLKYGGSTYKRTKGCPGWRFEADKAPIIPRASADANRGSALHWCMEQIDLFDYKPEHLAQYEGETIAKYEYTVTAEDVADLQTSADAMLALFDTYNIDEYEVEIFVKFAEDAGGYVDVFAWGAEFALVGDWKFGYQYVDAREQGLFYGRGAEAMARWRGKLEGRSLVVATVQPAVSSKALVHAYPPEDMTREFAKIDEAIDRARNGEGNLHAGDHCKYCPAAPYCPEKRGQASRFLALDPDHADQLAEAMSMVDDMKEQIKAVEREVFAALENDERVPGWKLVEKQARRHYTDEAEVTGVLRSSRVPQKLTHDSKLKSPAQLEKVLKGNPAWDKIQPHISKRSSGTTIAPESDKRPAVPGKHQIPENLAALMAKPAA